MTTYINTTNNLVASQLTNIVSGTGTLSFGNGLNKFGNTSYAVTLPSVANNSTNIIPFYSATTSNGLTTINRSGSSTISGQTSILIGTGDSGLIYCDGTNFKLLNFFLQPANFTAYLSANYTTLTNVSPLAPIIFDTEDRDIGSSYNNSTGVCTPTLPGVWVFGATSEVQTSGLAGATAFTLSLSKNGTAFATDSNAVNLIGNVSLSITKPQYMNGSTDTVSVSLTTGAISNQVVTGTIDKTYFFGYRLSLF